MTMKRLLTIVGLVTLVSSPSGIAQTLDKTGGIDAPISGDTSQSEIIQSTAINPDSPILPIQRTLVDKFSDTLTLRDYGMKLEPNEWKSDTAWLDANWPNFTRSTPVIIPAGAHWPDNKHVPKTNSATKPNGNQFPIVTALGAVNPRPGYDTNYGYGIPYYGDMVPSFTHDDANFTFARVDSNESSAGNFLPLGLFDMVYDTPYEGGGTGGSNNQIALEVRTTTTPSAQGTIGNFVSVFHSAGYNNYWGEMDVNKWSHTINHGTNWVWDNIQELYDEEPFYCNPSDTSLCFAEYMNEEDMYGAGPENPNSAFDPNVHNRMMFWLTTNHNISAEITQNTWAASKLIPAHKILFVKNPKNGHVFMFEGKHVGYVGNNSRSITGTVNGNVLTVTAVSHGTTIVPGSTYVFDNMLSDDITITTQTSGTTGGIGVYQISAAHTPNGFIITKPRTLEIANADGSRFSTTGTTEPTWTFTKGDKIADGTTTWTCIGPWQYDLGVVFAIGGSNDPTNGYVERIATVMSESTDYIYNAIIDMSKAAFDPNVPYNVFARLQKNMWIDFTADGTQSGQNNHLLGYFGGYRDSSGPHTGEFKFMVSKAASANGVAFTGMELGDDGTVDFPGLGTSHKNSGSHFLCIDDKGGIFKSDTACVHN